MARYDWPAPPRGEDRPTDRAAHLARYRPAADPRLVASAVPGSKAAKKGRRASAGAVPHSGPVGDLDLWLPIGPTVMTNGQATGDPNVAGRIRDIAVEPIAGQRIYAASAGGGAWFSGDRGNTWQPLDDFQVADLSDVTDLAGALTCGALHVIWGTAADGSQDVVWVGTGEPALTLGGLQAVAGGGPGGGLPGGKMLGIGFLNRDPAVDPHTWTVVKGEPQAGHADSLRGHGVYRIVADPGNKEQLVAATTNGLYLRPPGGTWGKITAYASGNHTQPADTLLTRAGNVVRVWVATASALKVAEFTGPPATAINPASLAFSDVGLPSVARNPLPGAPAGTTDGGTRIQLASDGTTVFALGRSVIPTDSKRTTPPAALWRVDATAPLLNLAGTLLTGLPADLFMSTGDQSDYDMCITTHPGVSGRVYVGGAVADGDAAIYRCETTASAVTATLIGGGVHADVHVLRVGPVSPSDATKHTVWVGCDGGIFRSDSDGDAGTFRNSNDGLAVLQPGYVSCHPSNPGVVVAGFQDNGTAVRVGDGVWRQSLRGDGGGVVFDPVPANPGRYFRQYVQASWESSDGGSTAPVERRNARANGNLKTSETIESSSSLFYSGAAALSYGSDTHLALGTDRVWYSRDWGRSWVTLPTGTDPRAADNPNLLQDVLNPIAGAAYSDTVGSTDCCSSTYVGNGTTGSGVIAVKLSPAPNDSSGNLVLRGVALYERGVVWLVGTRAGASGPFTWTPMATTPRQDIKDPLLTDEADFTAGNALRFLPAAGVVSDICVHDPTRGTLGSCYVTTTGVPFQRGSVVTIPRDTLWFFDGTDRWLPTGLRTGLSTGSWANNDQVTAPALGVLVDPESPSTVYVATSVGVVKGQLTIGGIANAPTYHWDWVRFMNGLPTAAVQDLALFSGSGLKLLRAATQSRGVWEVDLTQNLTKERTYLRLFATDTRRVLPTPTGGDLLNGDPHNPTHWDDSPDIVIDTTGVARTSPPTEVELGTIPAPGPATDQARVSTTDRHVKVHVLPHHRWKDVLPEAKVKVALLRHALPASGVVPISALWPTLVSAAGSAAAEPTALPDGWTKAAANTWQRPAGGVDPRVPRAVTFDVDLSADAFGSAVVLLAVVMSEEDQIGDADLALGGVNKAQTGDQLVVASPHVAAKSLEID
jgi:hypothetical protein